MMREATHRNGYQDSAFKFFTNTHARNKSESNPLLHEALNRFDCRELQTDVKRRVLSRECFDYFNARSRLHVVGYERLGSEILDLH